MPVEVVVPFVGVSIIRPIHDVTDNYRKSEGVKRGYGRENFYDSVCDDQYDTYVHC